MLNPFRKLFFMILYNLSLFLILFIGIQNSNIKKKVNLILGETIRLPISFIIGVSFISGSLSGGLTKINSFDKKE